MAQKLQSEGVGGIWSTIAEKVGDLKANLFSKITSYLVPTVLIAGITWIISLLNPASAFVKACKMIVDIVSFLVERGAQIVAFVGAVLDAVIAIAGGGTGGVPALIENALAMSIPVLIGAFAAILGIGGIAEKVKKFFQSLSKPVMKAVDWVVGKIVALGKKIWSKLKSGASKVRERARSLRGTEGRRRQEHIRPIRVGSAMTFQAGHESHRLWFRLSGSRAELTVASTLAPVHTHLDSVRRHLASASPDRQAEAHGTITQVEAAIVRIDPKANALARAEATRKAGGTVDDATVIGDEAYVVREKSGRWCRCSRVCSSWPALAEATKLWTCPCQTGSCLAV